MIMDVWYYVVVQGQGARYGVKRYKTVGGALRYIRQRFAFWRREGWYSNCYAWAIERHVRVANDSKLGFAFSVRSCTVAQSKAFDGAFGLRRDALVEAA